MNSIGLVTSAKVYITECSFPVVGFKKSVFLSSVADEVITRHDKLKLLRWVTFRI